MLCDTIVLHLYHYSLTLSHHHLPQKQSDTVSLLLSLGFEFDILHLHPISSCFISAIVIQSLYYPLF